MDRLGAIGRGARPRRQTVARTRATFVLDAGVVKDTYTLEYTWHGDDSVSWTLVEAQMLTAMDGSYRLTDRGGAGTDVEYVLTLDLKMPMIGLLAPQSREGRHRHRAEGAQASGRRGLAVT